MPNRATGIVPRQTREITRMRYCIVSSLGTGKGRRRGLLPESHAEGPEEKGRLTKGLKSLFKCILLLAGQVSGRWKNQEH